MNTLALTTFFISLLLIFISSFVIFGFILPKESKTDEIIMRICYNIFNNNFKIWNLNIGG